MKDKIRNITKRGEKYYLRMHVPLAFREIEPRKQLWASLKTTDPKIAIIRGEELYNRLMDGWELRLMGEQVDFKKIVRMCQGLGFSYRPISDVPDSEYKARWDAVMEAPEAERKVTAMAVLGAIEAPPLMVSELAEWYDNHTKYARQKKTGEQNRIWKSPFIRAAKEFVEVCGDMSVLDVDRSHAVAYRNHFKDRIDEGGYSPSSANKSIASLRSMIKNVLLERAPDALNPMQGMALSEAKSKKSRNPMPDEMIRDILEADALQRMNAEARDILLTTVNTGCRPSEICGLQASHIHLDQNIPYFDLIEDGRELKNQASARKVVLVGVSLEAMRRNPSGFKKYRGKHTTLSTTVNKFLRENKMITPEYSFYSLRHSFKDRLRSLRIEDSLMDQLMGHAEKGEKYGEGYDLHAMHEALNQISYS